MPTWKNLRNGGLPTPASSINLLNVKFHWVSIQYSSVSYKKAKDPGDGGDRQLFKAFPGGTVGMLTSGKEWALTAWDLLGRGSWSRCWDGEIGSLGKERRPERQAFLVDKCSNFADEWRGPNREVYRLRRNRFSKCVIAMQIYSPLLSAELFTILMTIFPKLTEIYLSFAVPVICFPATSSEISSSWAHNMLSVTQHLTLINVIHSKNRLKKF